MYRRAIEQEKTVYKESFEKLRTLKPEIEHIKMLLEKGRATLQQQFDQWFNSLYSRRGVIISTGAPSKNGASSTAPETISALPSPRRHSVDSSSIGVAEAKSVSTLRSSFSSKIESNDVNEDIMAFYQAKEELLKRRAK
jgi:kinesin family protein 6/9